MTTSRATTSSTARSTDKIEPDHYWQNGAVPVFKPTWDQFKSFPDFIAKIDAYGMKAGIVKVIPPKEWLDQLPDLDDKVKDIRVRSAIEQNFAGSSGAFKQMNIEKQRSYNLVQWRKICESTDHQPPARRGQVRGSAKSQQQQQPQQHQQQSRPSAGAEPSTPSQSTARPATRASTSPRSPAVAQKSTREKMHIQGAAASDFDNFDYRFHDTADFTPERCTELEKAYWKSLTYNQPLYGADLPGSLFHDSVKSWNVAHLDNILNKLGKVLPGVNSAYLYLGMWKASFSWHVEDMDLYSINYIHFGAPKQWYSVSQEDNSKFETVMRNIFPDDAHRCSQFMRHKTFGASPARLAQHGVNVNRLVHYEKEFVITFPYGYHSGYNLGYNCAESVNFATEDWLEFGRVAEKCECIHDAVTIDVDDIIQSLRGNKRQELPTPPASDEGSEDEDTARKASNKRKQPQQGGLAKKLKRELRAEASVTESASGTLCAFCSTEDKRFVSVNVQGKLGTRVHRICAALVPETAIDPVSGMVVGFDDVPRARQSLRCAHCKLAGGALFQCTAAKCVRAFHGTCALAAGVLIGEFEQNQDGSRECLCRVHRPRRAPRHQLEFDATMCERVAALKVGAQVQVILPNGDTSFGIVRENRRSERMLLVERRDLGDVTDVIELDYTNIFYDSSALTNDRLVFDDLCSLTQSQAPKLAKKARNAKSTANGLVMTNCSLDNPTITQRPDSVVQL
ncbi:hypothetical protein PYCC9005_002642 [Savitreella phatthalungensis]